MEVAGYADVLEFNMRRDVVGEGGAGGGGEGLLEEVGGGDAVGEGEGVEAEFGFGVVED